MPSLNITSTHFARASGGPVFEGTAAEAKQDLVRIAASLRTANGRGVVQGYLRLRTNARQQLALDKNLLGTNSRANTEATQLIRDMVTKAYGDRHEVQQALTDYLRQSNQRVGTQSFVKLIQTLEQASPASEPGQQPDQQTEAYLSALRRMRPATNARIRTDAIGPASQANAASAPIHLNAAPQGLENSGVQVQPNRPQSLPVASGPPGSDKTRESIAPGMAVKSDESIKPSISARSNAAVKPMYLSTVKSAIGPDGVRRPIRLGEAPVDGDCALHAASRALGRPVQAPITRADVVTWVREDLSGGQSENLNLIASFIAADLSASNTAEYANISASQVEGNPQHYLSAWAQLFADRERIWGSDKHLQYIMRRHDRPLDIYIADPFNPGHIKHDSTANPTGSGERVNVVILNPNTRQPELNFNARMKDENTGLDYQAVVELNRMSEADRLQALQANKAFVAYAKQSAAQVNQADESASDDWGLSEPDEDESAQDPLPPQTLTLAFQEIKDELYKEALQGNHWDAVFFD